LASAAELAFNVVRRVATWLAAICATAVLLALPTFADPYLIYIANLMLAYVVVSVGFNILLGYAGQFAFASAAFMAVGAYALALIMSRMGGSWLIALPVAGVAASILGALIAIPALRLKTVYLAMVTMAFAELVQWVLVQWKDVTLGTDGVNVPFPAIATIRLGSDGAVYYLILAVTILCVALARRLLMSRIGRALIAVRENELVAQCNGIDVARTKGIAFCASAFLAGIGGALFALSLRYIVPDGFGLFQLVVHFSMVLIGGLGSLIGSIIGAVLLTALPELLRGAQAFQEIIYGVLLIAFIVFFPKGLAGILNQSGLLPREILVRGWRRVGAERGIDLHDRRRRRRGGSIRAVVNGPHEPLQPRRSAP
jgi:branched-chain amino acid transport system permease protein